jgi:hypothetical protein
MNHKKQKSKKSKKIEKHFKSLSESNDQLRSENKRLKTQLRQLGDDTITEKFQVMVKDSKESIEQLQKSILPESYTKDVMRIFNVIFSEHLTAINRKISETMKVIHDETLSAHNEVNIKIMDEIVQRKQYIEGIIQPSLENVRAENYRMNQLFESLNNAQNSDIIDAQKLAKELKVEREKGQRYFKSMLVFRDFVNRIAKKFSRLDKANQEWKLCMDKGGEKKAENLRAIESSIGEIHGQILRESINLARKVMHSPDTKDVDETLVSTVQELETRLKASHDFIQLNKHKLDPKIAAVGYRHEALDDNVLFEKEEDCLKHAISWHWIHRLSTEHLKNNIHYYDSQNKELITRIKDHNIQFTTEIKVRTINWAGVS